MPELRMKGETFRCIDEMPLDLLMEMASVGQGFAMLGFYHRMLPRIVIEEDQPALRETLGTMGLDDLEELDNSIGELFKEYTAHPSSAPSSSRPGPRRTGGRSRVVSLSPDTAREEPESSTDGQSRAS